MRSVYLQTVVITLFGVWSAVESFKDDPEIHMNTSELIRYHGYKCEDYQVHTEDGYILDIQRIPNGKPGKRVRRGGPWTKRGAVLLQHGLLSCSACWVENLANESLAFQLADAGYDVWLGNSRGNTYGLKHEKLNKNQSEFWEFSWDEMAKYDLPATVDLILRVSQFFTLTYIGHSQGTEIGFAALATNDPLNTKIDKFIALGPAAYLGDIKSPIRLLKNWTEEEVHDWFGDKDFLPNSTVITYLVEKFCPKKMPGFICENILFLVTGFDFKNMNMSRFPVYVGQHPAGTSVQNMIHYLQAVNTNKFQMFDFGPDMNMKKYNQSTPPQYDLNKIRRPVDLYVGSHDWLTTVPAVQRIRSELTSRTYYKDISHYDHLDYIWAIDATKVLYDEILNRLP